jgi:hypothetical protein
MFTKEFVRQKDNPGALLNIDNAGLENYKSKRKLMAVIKEQDEKINKLESSLEEIKKMLVNILETGNNK